MNRRRGVTPNSALRLEKLFRASVAFWLRMQQDYDLRHEMHSSRGEEIAKIEPMRQAA